MKEILKYAGYNDYEIAVYMSINPPTMGSKIIELFEKAKDILED